MNLYPFIEAEKAGQHSVVKACELLGVSRSAFYEWHQHIPSVREIADAELAVRIEAIWDASKGTYGWPRVHAELRREGVRVSRKRVARIMRSNGLHGRCRRRWCKTTIPDPAVQAGVDLIKRVFGPGTVEIDTVYVGDITYIWTWQGWAYLATVIDLGSRRVVGWALADHMRTELVADALKMAINIRHPEPGLIFHSDRGSQYTSSEYTDLLAEHRIRQSLSRPRQCWDNAVAEAWFGTFKRELIERHTWATHRQLRAAVFEYIEITYNRNRIHSTLDYLTPVEYESRQIHQPPTTQAA